MPFAPGEMLMGYQACGLKGNVYIGVGGKYGEKLTNIANGDEAVFRYVKSDRGYKKVSFELSGSGNAEILMNGKKAGEITFRDGKQETDMICMPAGEYEVTLRFEEVERLEIDAFILE